MTLYIFIIATALTIVLIMIRVFEERVGRKTFFTETLSRGDIFIDWAKARAKDSFHHGKHRTIFFILVHLPERIEKFFAGLKRRAHGKYHDMSARMRGKQNFPTNKEASPFVRNLSERNEKRFP